MLLCANEIKKCYKTLLASTPRQQQDEGKPLVKLRKYRVRFSFVYHVWFGIRDFTGYFPSTMMSVIEVFFLPCEERLENAEFLLNTCGSGLTGWSPHGSGTTQVQLSLLYSRRQICSLLPSQGSRSCLEHHTEPSGSESFPWLQQNRLQ